MPLYIKNTLQKIIILDITPTVLDLLTWDLAPRWIISFYLDYLNDHYSPTHHDMTHRNTITCDTFSTVG